MTKFYIQKTWFLTQFQSTFPILGAKQIPPEYPALLHTISYQFLALCLNLEKTNDTLSRNHPDRKME